MTHIEVHIALGTNLGDRRANLLRAIELLREKVQITRLSSLYETEAAYVTDQPEFMNMALAGRIDPDALSPRELLRFVNDIERRMGRERLVRYGPRVIDVDILSYGDQHILEPDLIIPHPRIAERDFVLAPLREIAPDLILAGQTKTVAELASALPGIGKVMRVEQLPGDNT
jgi:2-amino-4-hydroxy-6-hydroxymethyldihydropteridine diphosphokinase